MGLQQVVALVKEWIPRASYRYSAVTTPVELRRRGDRPTETRGIWSTQNRRLLKVTAGGMILLIMLYIAIAFRCVRSMIPLSAREPSRF
jgi:hypothetical protein